MRLAAVRKPRERVQSSWGIITCHNAVPEPVFALAALGYGLFPSRFRFWAYESDAGSAEACIWYLRTIFPLECYLSMCMYR
jgi:uncharacterized protein (DUF1800 family)